MKKTRVLLVVLLALFVGFLTACTSTEDLLDVAKEALVANYAETISEEDFEVTENLTLVTEIEGATVSWASSNTAIITAAGVVTRPETDTNVTLTATITIEGETITQTFRVLVKAVEVTVAERLAAAKTALVANYAATIGDDEYEVMANLTLVTTIGDGATVTWASSDTAIVAVNGTVTRPSFSTGDQTVTLTATIAIGTENTTQVFYAFVPALDKTVNETLQEALALVTTFPANDGVTGAEEWLVFPATQVLGETTYDVVWTSDKPEFLAIDGTVTRPASGEADELVTMTASITVGEVTETMEVQFNVFAIEASKTLASIADVYAEDTGTYVRFEGVTVIGKMTAGFFISDGTTMLYIYDSATLYNDVVIGSVYDIEGVYGLYFNAPQLANDASRPLTATASTETAASMNGTASTVSEAIATKPTPSAANLMVYDYLSITGKVMVDSRETVDVGRYNTFLVDTTFAGTEVIKTLASGKATEYNTPAIVIYYQSPSKAAVEALDGENVTINILLYGWRTDRNIWYAVYLGDGTDIDVDFATDADAVAAVKTSLTQPATITDATTLDLLDAQYGATVTWASNNETVINSTTGVVTPVAGQQVTVELTATITKGLETDTKVFTIKVGELPVVTVAEARAIAVTADVKTDGLLLIGDNNRTFVLHDSTGAIAIYSSDSTILAALNTNVNKQVEIIGVRSANGGNQQITVATITALGDAVDVVQKVNLDDKDFTQLLPYQSYVGSASDLVVVSVYTSSSNNTTVTLSNLAGQNIVVYHSNYAVVPAEEVTYLKSLTVGTVVNVVDAVIGWYNSPQFLYLGQSQVVTVAPENYSDAVKVYFDSKELTVPATVVEATTLTLPTTGTKGSTIVWTSSNTDVITDAGVVTLPVSGQVTVTLTATLTLGTVEKVVTFDVLVGVPAEGLTTLLTYTFGPVAKTGYAIGDLTWTESFGDVTIAKDRVQINTSTSAPHTAGNPFLVVAPRLNNATPVMTFNWTAVNVQEIHFDYSSWSSSAASAIAAFTSADLVLEKYNTTTEAWDLVDTLDMKTVNGSAYTTTSFDATGAGTYRISFVIVGTLADSNTAQALTIDNMVLKG